MYNKRQVCKGEINMKIISLFNNKGGVGKSTLGFHLGHALGDSIKKFFS